MNIRKNTVRKNTYSDPESKDWLFSGILIFAITLICEMLLFVNAQTDKLSSEISKDFTILLTLDPAMSEQRESIENQIKKIVGVKKADFVSKDAQLKKIEQQDSELVKAAREQGNNPLPDTWEVGIEDNAYFRLGDNDEENEESIANKLLSIEGVSEFQYKKPEAWALKHLFFYKKFTMVALLFSGLAFSSFILGVLIKENSLGETLSSISEDYVYAVFGAVGSILALGAVLVFLYPVRNDNFLWSWTSTMSQILLVFCGSLLSWAIRRWKLLDK